MGAYHGSLEALELELTFLPCCWCKPLDVSTRLALNARRLYEVDGHARGIQKGGEVRGPVPVSLVAGGGWVVHWSVVVAQVGDGLEWGQGFCPAPTNRPPPPPWIRSTSLKRLPTHLEPRTSNGQPRATSPCRPTATDTKTYPAPRHPSNLKPACAPKINILVPRNGFPGPL